jgi:hypothetical protein
MTKLVGSSDADDGVLGTTSANDKNGMGALNTSTKDAAFLGGNAMFGVTTAPGGNGVFGSNNSATKGRGVQGNGPEAGVGGFSDKGVGVLAQSGQGDGLHATTGSSAKSAVFASNGSTAPASAKGGHGVLGLTVSPGGAGVFGANNSPTTGRGVQGNGPEAGVGGFSEKGVGVLAQSGGVALKAQGPLAGRFEGDVEVTGDIRLVNADCAEDFDVAIDGTAEPGTVVVFDAHGALRPSISPYDKKVVGIVSGAGQYKPAIVLDRQESLQHRAPVALMGKVFCNVNADEHAIEVGDLLTTSSCPGHAMKATDPSRAFGAVIGKALRPLASGRGKIPVLVALQ